MQFSVVYVSWFASKSVSPHSFIFSLQVYFISSSGFSIDLMPSTSKFVFTDCSVPFTCCLSCLYLRLSMFRTKRLFLNDPS